jgi:hypothetical protein
MVSAPMMRVGVLAPFDECLRFELVATQGPNGGTFTFTISADLVLDLAASPVPWSPLQLGSKLKLWFSADHGVSLAADVVSSWQDRILGYTISQATAANRPALRTINDKTWIDFDGQNDSLAGSVNVSAALGTPGRFSMIAAAYVDAFASSTGFSAPAIARTASSNRIALTVGGGAQKTVYGNAFLSPGNSRSASGDAASSVAARARAEYDGTNVRAKFGSDAEGTYQDAAGQVATNYDYGLLLGFDADQEYLDGAVRHLFVTVPELTASEHALLDAWLAADCGAQT